MIVQEVVNGKSATVSYLTADLQLCEPAQAEMVKVIFNDGSGVLFGTRAKPVTQL